MPLKFAMKGSKEKRVYAAHATGELEIKGLFHCKGPQPIDDNGGAPQWIADLFDRYPDIDKIALSGEKHSVVYGRMKED